MWWAKQLCSSLGYLKITQRNGSFYQSKRLYDFVLPLVFSLGTTGIFLILPKPPAIFDAGGLLSSIREILQLLIPFFIAALAAVATFDRPSMDKETRGIPLSTKRWSNEAGEFIEHRLTRRQFICQLFGYLAFVSFLLWGICLSAQLIQPSIADIQKNLTNAYILQALPYLKGFLLFIFWAIFWNILITTGLGLHFLTDRMQYDD